MPEATAKAEALLTPQSEVTRPITGIRKLIAERMALSHRVIPGVHVIEEIDVTDLDLRLLLATTTTAVARTVADHPRFNAHVVDDQLIEFGRCDVGIAVDTKRGLMAPVVRDCGARSVENIQAGITQLAERARAGKLTPAEMTGATITVTSPGKRGGLLATPLISHPQTAIIGVHRAEPRVAVRNNGIAIRTIANLTVTFDHRVIDGAEAGDFAIALRSRIEASESGRR